MVKSQFNIIIICNQLSILHPYTHTNINTHTHMQHTRTQHTHTNINTHTHTKINTNTLTYTHIHTHAHTRTHNTHAHNPHIHVDLHTRVHTHKQVYSTGQQDTMTHRTETCELLNAYSYMHIC